MKKEVFEHSLDLTSLFQRPMHENVIYDKALNKIQQEVRYTTHTSEQELLRIDLLQGCLINCDTEESRTKFILREHDA